MTIGRGTAQSVPLPQEGGAPMASPNIDNLNGDELARILCDVLTVVR